MNGKAFKIKGGWGWKRKKPAITKNAIIVYQRAKGDWVINFPDGYHHYGKTIPAEVISLFAYLAEGKTLEQARRKIGWR